LASPGKRLPAYVLDLAIPVFVLLSILGVGAGLSSSGSGIGGQVAVLLSIGYGIWALTLFARGTTPGKRLLGMHVVKEGGEAAGFGRMFLRELIGKVISALVFSLGSYGSCSIVTAKGGMTSS
jgi:uncharacterized RDD family membrane protein YckC